MHASNSLTFLGAGIFVMAATRCGSGRFPFLSIINSRHKVSSGKNKLFSGVHLKPNSESLRSTVSSVRKYSSLAPVSVYRQDKQRNLKCRQLLDQ